MSLEFHVVQRQPGLGAVSVRSSPEGTPGAGACSGNGPDSQSVVSIQARSPAGITEVGHLPVEGGHTGW